MFNGTVQCSASISSRTIPQNLHHIYFYSWNNVFNDKKTQAQKQTFRRSHQAELIKRTNFYAQSAKHEAKHVTCTTLRYSFFVMEWNNCSMYISAEPSAENVQSNVFFLYTGKATRMWFCIWLYVLVTKNNVKKFHYIPPGVTLLSSFFFAVGTYNMNYLYASLYASIYH